MHIQDGALEDVALEVEAEAMGIQLIDTTAMLFDDFATFHVQAEIHGVMDRHVFPDPAATSAEEFRVHIVGDPAAEVTRLLAEVTVFPDLIESPIDRDGNLFLPKVAHTVGRPVLVVVLVIEIKDALGVLRIELVLELGKDDVLPSRAKDIIVAPGPFCFAVHEPF